MNTPTRSAGGGLQERTTAAPGRFPVSTDEAALVERLRGREEAAFSTLVSRYHASLLRVARLYVPSHAVAEEVVQETWLGVLQGIDRFEGCCSLKTWIFQILINRARTRGEREGRSIPFSAAWDPSADLGEPSVDPSRFTGPDDPEWPYGWVTQPRSWGITPEQCLLSKEFRQHLERAIAALPPSQREVITLRDIQEWTTEEVCNVLGISETNGRVLLHRARSRVRQAMEDYIEKR